MPNLINRAEKLVEARKAVATETTPLLETLKDKSIPLNERWECYTILVENDVLTSIQGYGDGELDYLGDLTQYDDFHNDRGVTVMYTDMYDCICEAEEQWDPALYEAKANLPVWQERVLEKGFAGFNYDW